MCPEIGDVSLLVIVIKYHDQKQPIEEFYSGLWFQKGKSL